MFVCSYLVEPGHVLLIEERGVAAVDREDQPIINPLMHGLPFHIEELAHVSDGEQLSWSLFFKEAKHCSMHEFTQVTPLPFLGQAETLSCEGVPIEAASDNAGRSANISFKCIGKALGVVGNGCQMLSEQGLT